MAFSAGLIGTDYKITGYEYDGKILGRQDCPPENAKITVTVEGKGSYQGVNTISYELRTGTSWHTAAFAENGFFRKITGKTYFSQMNRCAHNFTGTYDRVKTTVIDKNMLLNKAKIAKIPNQEYRKGQEIILADSMVKVTLNGTMLVKDTDYTLVFCHYIRHWALSYAAFHSQHMPYPQ